MRYTLLRLTARGVVLRDLHARRLGVLTAPARTAFDRFAAGSPPGVYALWLEGDVLRVEARPESRLFDGMPGRYLPSPCIGLKGRSPKPGTPGPYDAVRVAGLATLLTTADGAEVLEACCAGVLAWDGERLLHPPDDRPRVWSTAEEAVRLHLPARATPIRVEADLPLLLVNAVKGPCQVTLPGRTAVGAGVVQRIRGLLDDLTR